MNPEVAVSAPRTMVHLSDLHIGRSPAWLAKTIALRDCLRAQNVDDLIVTGDITEHGSFAEFNIFQELFRDFIDTQRLIMVPGNHDRLENDEVARQIMGDRRVTTVRRPGLHLICIDSTGSHNRHFWTGHGKLDEPILKEVDDSIEQAYSGDLIGIILHHHLVPLPEEWWMETLSTWFGLPGAREVRLGRALIERLQGRCDVILHGHRHVPREIVFQHPTRPLKMFNGGSSTLLGRFRIFQYQQGRLLNQPSWIGWTA